MAESAKIQDLNFSHHAVIDWLLANPEKDYKDCALAFNYTQAWLSTIVHSDAFKLEFARRRSLVSERITDQLAGLSHKAIAKLDTFVENLDVLAEGSDVRLLLEIGDRALHRQGYAPANKGASINLNTLIVNAPVDKQLLSDARQQMKLVHQNGLVPLEHNANAEAT